MPSETAAEFFAAIDIGGTKTSLAIGTRNGTIVARQVCPTEPDVTPDIALTNAITSLQRLAGTHEGRLNAIGLSCPGPIDFDRSMILNPPNMPPSWFSFPIVSFVAERSGLPVLIENDANAAVIGEQLYGAGRGFTELLYLTISTGIGGGIISESRLVHRRGEAGHVTVRSNGDMCGCGARGCLEAMCSGTAIARRASERRNMRLTAEMVVEAVKAGEVWALDLWQETIELMAVGIGSLIAALAPQAVILGGGVAAGAGEFLLRPLREAIAQRVRILPLTAVRVVQAGLGSDSALYGALALASSAVLNDAR